MIGEPNVVTLFERAAVARGDSPAIVGPDGRVRWSFGGLAERAASLAGALTRLGIGPGDRVLVLEPDLARRYAVIGAVLWAGAAVLVPPTSVRAWRAMTVVASTAPRAVVFGPALWPLVLAHPALRSLPIRIASAGPRLLGAASLDDIAGPPIAPTPLPGTATALASFTTGSTGTPKLVLRSHDVLRAQHEALGHLRGLADDDVDLVGLPALVLHNLAAGVTSVLPPAARSPSYPTLIRETIARSRPTSAVGFPHLVESAVRGAAAAELGGLRAIQVGGSRVSAGLASALGVVAPAARVTVVYGSTEVEPIAAIAGDAYVAALAASTPAAGVCVGRILGGLELRLEPTGSEDAITGHPEGVIDVRGPRAAARPGEWVATGDIGWLDDEDRVWLLGRTANARAGLRPFEVELTVERLDWVRHAALTRRVDRPAARTVLAVEPQPGTAGSRDRLVAELRCLLAEHRWAIDDVVVRSKLPRTAGPAAKPAPIQT